MEKDPDTWLKVCESIFKTKGTEDKDTRFHHLIARLPSKINLKIKDVLHMPEGAARYNTLKKRLTALFSLSSHDRYLRLHSMPALGSNQRPSDMLSNLWNLVPSDSEESDFWFCHLFISKLPIPMKSRCLEHDDLTIDQLASMMDKLVVDDLSSNYIHTIQEEVVEDDNHASDVHHCCSVNTSNLCFYHEKFKNHARQCRPPCSWTKRAPGNAKPPGRK